MRSDKSTTYINVNNLIKDTAKTIYEDRLNVSKNEFLENILQQEKTVDSYLPEVQERNIKNKKEIKKKDTKTLAKNRNEISKFIQETQHEDINPTLTAFLLKISDDDLNQFDDKQKMLDYYYMKYNFYIIKVAQPAAKYQRALEFHERFKDYATGLYSLRFIKVVGQSNLLGSKVKHINDELQKLNSKINSITKAENTKAKELATLQESVRKIFISAFQEKMKQYFPQLYRELQDYREESISNRILDQFEPISGFSEPKKQVPSEVKSLELKKVYDEFLSKYDYSPELNKNAATRKNAMDDYVEMFIATILPKMAEVSKNKKVTVEEIKKDILDSFEQKLQTESHKTETKSTKQTFVGTLSENLNKKYEEQENFKHAMQALSPEGVSLLNRHKADFVNKVIFNSLKTIIKDEYPNLEKELTKYTLAIESITLKMNEEKRKNYHDSYVFDFIKKIPNSIRQTAFKNLLNDMYELNAITDSKTYNEFYLNKVLKNILACDPNLLTEQERLKKLSQLQDKINQKADAIFSDQIKIEQEKVASQIDKLGAEPSTKIIATAPSETVFETMEKLQDDLGKKYDDSQPIMSPADTEIWKQNKTIMLNQVIAQAQDDVLQLNYGDIKSELNKFGLQLAMLTQQVSNSRSKIESFANQKFNQNNPNIPALVKQLASRYLDVFDSGIEPMKALNKAYERMNPTDQQLFLLIRENNNNLVALTQYKSQFINNLIDKNLIRDDLKSSYEKLFNDYSFLQKHLHDQTYVQVYFDKIIPDIIACDPNLQTKEAREEKLHIIKQAIESQANEIFSNELSKLIPDSTLLATNPYAEVVPPPNPDYLIEENIQGIDIDLPQPSAPPVSLNEIAEQTPVINPNAAKELIDAIFEKHAKAAEEQRLKLEQEEALQKAFNEQQQKELESTSHTKKEDESVKEVNVEGEQQEIKAEKVGDNTEEIKEEVKKAEPTSPLPATTSAVGIWGQRKNPEELKDFTPGELGYLNVEQFKKLIENGSINEANTLKSAHKDALRRGLEALKSKTQDSELLANINRILEMTKSLEKTPVKVTSTKKPLKG